MGFDSGDDKAITFYLGDISSIHFDISTYGDGILSQTFTCEENIKGNSIKVIVSGYCNWAGFNENYKLSIVEK